MFRVDKKKKISKVEELIEYIEFEHLEKTKDIINKVLIFSFKLKIKIENSILLFDLNCNNLETLSVVMLNKEGYSKDDLKKHKVQFNINIEFELINSLFKNGIDLSVNRAQNDSHLKLFFTKFKISNSKISRIESNSVNSSRVFINISDSNINTLLLRNVLFGSADISNSRFNTLELPFQKYEKKLPYIRLYNVSVSFRLNIPKHLIKDKDIDIQFLRISKARKSDIEIIRLFKQNFEKSSNTFDFLNAIACEQRILNNSLWKINRWNEQLGDKLLLFLNRISNGYGISWTRGLVFTILISLLGSILLNNLIYDGPYKFFEPSTNYLEILFSNFSPIYKIDFLKDNDAGFWLYFLHFCTKILVLYGIYQTIQAFRKYRR
ncbi:hypothetical protein [Aquimarina litoralis]|uniref:hypothetical protein n=1 Tax=Aquimarina litoralis TaxID=584605 RepID=UPI001C578FC3|nr:hypothetical protein [Aquimarina litoralis]MBW1295286.1 hypothetical protein [Aquimarina litoralis]